MQGLQGQNTADTDGSYSNVKLDHNTGSVKLDGRNVVVAFSGYKSIKPINTVTEMEDVGKAMMAIKPTAGQINYAIELEDEKG